MRAAVFRVVCIFVCFNSAALGASLTAETLAAWNGHVSTARAQLEREAGTPAAFMSGEMPEFLVESREPSGYPVPEGLVHHWFGTELIPGAHVSELLSVMHNYDGYKTIFCPAVVESRLQSSEDNIYNYHLKVIQKGLGVRSGLLADFQSRYVRVADGSGYVVTESVNLIELQNPGKPNERQLSLADSKGFIEKSFTVIRYRQIDQGVVIRIESITLSRDVPGSIRWLVEPFIHRFARQTMSTTLERIRDHVLEESARTSVARR